MTDVTGDLLAEITRLARELQDPDLTAKERQRLETRKADAQERARQLSLAGRHPRSVEAQLETLAARRAEIMDEFIKPGYSEKRGGKLIQDPGAYSHNINKLLQEKAKQELDEIDAQLALLKRPDTGYRTPDSESR